LGSRGPDVGSRLGLGLGSRTTIARRELLVLAAEKTIVLALVIQLFVAGFSSFLVVGLVSLYDPGPAGATTVDVAVAGEATDDLLAAVDDRDGLDPTVYGGTEQAVGAFSAGRVDAVLLAERQGGRAFVTAVAPENDIRTTLVVVQVREALRAYERAERAERTGWLDRRPLALPERTRSSPYYGFTYTVLVPLLVFLPVFISGSIAVDSITEEIDRGTLELLRVAPVSLADIVDGKLLAAAGIAPLQSALWLALLSLNGTSVGRPGVLVLVAAALAVAVTGAGAAIALTAPDRRAAQFLYSLCVLGLFGATTLLPGDPANTVARLAVGSATTGTAIAVAVYVVGAAVVYALVRAVVSRATPEAL
jgi:ABC-type Na+ efflux pump permease subunit